MNYDDDEGEDAQERTSRRPHFGGEEVREFSRWSSSSASAPNISTRRRASTICSSPVTKRIPSRLRYSIAASSVRRSVSLGPFADGENTFWPSGCEIFVYRDGKVMVNSSYDEIPDNQSMAYLDGVSTKALIDTIVITSDPGERKIGGFTPPTRLDHMSVEEIARAVSEGDLGVLATASCTSRHRTLALPHFSDDDDDDDEEGGPAGEAKRTSPDIETNPDIIWGKVMPNSMPSGVTLLTKQGSVVHISDSPKNTFLFPKAHVDHRIRLVLLSGGGIVRLSYFTGGLNFSPEAVVVLSKPEPSEVEAHGKLRDRSFRLYGGNLSLLLRTQNSTATEFKASKLRLSMARVGPLGRPMAMTMLEESRSRGVSKRGGGESASSSSSQTRTSVGPIDVFEYRGVMIPMGTNYTTVMETKLSVVWSLRYDIQDIYSEEPSIYAGIRSKDKDVPPSSATFILKEMRVGWTRIRRALPKTAEKYRFFHLGEDTMVEIQNVTSSSEGIRKTLVTVSHITVVNRKGSDVSVTLYRNLTAEEEFIKDDFEVAASEEDRGFFFDSKLSPLEKLPVESAEYATKRSDTAKVLVVRLYNISKGGGTVRVTTVVTRPYKRRKSMQKLYLYKERESLASTDSVGSSPSNLGDDRRK